MFAIFLTKGMDPFYQNISSFPTVLFTVLLALCVLYWAVSVLGFVDLDAIDIDLPDAADGSSGPTPDVLAGLMLKFGLYGVPLIVIVTGISLFGWLVSYYSVHFMLALVPEGLLRYLLGLPILGFALYVAVMITGWVIRPLRPLFRKAEQETIKRVLGQVAIVRTSKVTNHFGEADFSDGGAGLILKVRATGDEEYKRGERVVLLEYNKMENTYRVVSEEEFRGM